ncbi:hypothetical protein ACFYXS_02760 [Streptomyces sp. NPDC002574]|uniref:hypothetical protein n=1 Tax=Streptomyces sp. NPDC002574 TaxID=3364652 RepID=UPI0036B8CEB9
MTDNKTPDPPEPSGYAAWTEPEIHVHLTHTEESRWDFSWMKIGKNLGAATAAFIPANIWASALHDVQREQSIEGAWFMAGAGLVIALVRFAHHRGFFSRTLLWIAVLGGFLALPVFSSVVDIMTGGGR